MTGLAAAWNWWLDGLTDIVAAREAGRLGQRRVRLRSGTDGRLLPADAARLPGLGGKAVDLVLAPGETLVRTLDPLPAESRAYLDGIVRHNLERITPWRSDEVLKAYFDEPAGPADPRLLVTIVATARPLLAGRLEALRAAGILDVRLLAPAAGPQRRDAIIEIGDGSAAASGLARGRRRVKRGLVMLAAAGAVVATGLTWALLQADQRLARATAAVAEQRGALLGAPGATRKTRDADAVWRKKLESTPAVQAVEALAAALPDDTSLTELRFADGRVRITGVSRNVTALIPVIERTPGFAEPRFFAPTIRLPDGQGNQFHLEARLPAPARAAP